MDKRTYYNILYDYYSNLLTEKERTYFQDYYNNDFSLTEIAEDQSVSRSAIHKTLKNVIDKLNKFEETLSLYHKKEKIISLLQPKIDRETLEELKNIL